MRDPRGVGNTSASPGRAWSATSSRQTCGTLFVVLKPGDERKAPELHALALRENLRQRLQAIEGGRLVPFNPPPFQGLGSAGGFNMKVQDRGGKDVASLAEAADLAVAATRQRKELAGVITTFSANEPQVWLDVDRDRCKILGVPISDVFTALQTYLGGLYLNDFNPYGRTFRVLMQAEPEYRQKPEDLERFYVRSTSGHMVPVSELVKLNPTSGPLALGHFNGLRSADILGGPAPGYSSGQAIAAMEEVAQKVLPPGFGHAWTTMAYQEKKAAGTAGPVFVFAILMVFLFLAAQYESWVIPFAVIFGVLAGVLGAILFVWGVASPTTSTPTSG